MKANVGTFDRVVRIILGLVLIVLPFILATEAGPVAALGGFGWLAMIVGAVILLTGVMRFCLLYRILGICTCQTSTN